VESIGVCGGEARKKSRWEVLYLFSANITTWILFGIVDSSVE
jgi:hypothetical protein